MPNLRNGECFMFEKIYLIYNPLTGTKDWVSEREFNIGSQKLKHVFGVLYLNDVKFMLKFNPAFKESIMKECQISSEEKISLFHVCRLISKRELTELMDRDAVANIQSDTHKLFSSYPSSIELSDGFFIWNEKTGCYEEAAVNEDEKLTM
jgi:hypothetical protein